MKTHQELMTDNLIVKHYAGSTSYGTSLPTSDIDFRGIFVADPINIRTPFFPIKEVEDKSEEDTKLYELNQFMRLAVDCNPNIIESLWVDPQHIVMSTPAYDLLRSHACDLLTKKIAFTTTGYALSQLKRLKGHHKWINKPQPVDPPAQTDYLSLVHNFTEAKMFKLDLSQFTDNCKLVPYGTSETGNIFGVYKSDGGRTHSKGNLCISQDKEIHTLGTPLILVKFNKQLWSQDKDKWSQYWDWKNNRNAVRSELEEKYGYDAKHAMHLVRLLRIGKEALEDGVINVFRPDAADLLDIRGGKWTYEQLIAYAEDMDNQIRTVLYHKSSLPTEPNYQLAGNLILQIQEMVWTNP